MKHVAGVTHFNLSLSHVVRKLLFVHHIASSIEHHMNTESLEVKDGAKDTSDARAKANRLL